MSFSSISSGATFLSHEGVFFEVKGSHDGRTSSSTTNSVSSTAIPRKWSRTSLTSVESQTSICPIHISVIATRDDTPTNSHQHQSILSRLGFSWTRKQSSSYQWGWRQAAPIEVPISVSALAAGSCGCSSGGDSDEEADLSGWEHCGVVFGNGAYDDGEEEC